MGLIEISVYAVLFILTILIFRYVHSISQKQHEIEENANNEK